MHWSRSSSGGLPWVVALVLVTVASATGSAEILSLGRSLGTHGPPSVVSDQRGDGLVLADGVRPVTGADIYAWPLRSSATTSHWPQDGLAVCSASEDQLNPVAASDGHGGYVVAWEDWRNAKEPHIYAQHILASGVLDPAWSPEGLLVSGETGAHTLPRIITTGDGGALIAWHELRGELLDVSLQRLSPSGRLLPDWPTSGLRISDQPGERTSVALLPDGSGGALVSWFQSGEEAEWTLLAQHVLGSAELDAHWPTGGMVVRAQLDGTSSSAMVSDGAGGAIVAWTDRRHEGVANVYARRVLASGEADPRWPEQGAVVSVEATGQRYPSLVADGASGAFVAWQDARLEGSESVYAQHLTDAGGIAPGWPERGLRVSAEQGQRVGTQILELGPDLLVAWIDRTTPGNPRPQVQHVFREGRLDPSWPDGGAVLTSEPVADMALGSAKDDAGACVWRDMRSPGLQIVPLSSHPPAPETPGGPAIPSVTMLLPPRPNPARGEIAFHFSLASRAAARLTVFDLQGRRIATLIDGTLDAGPHQALWSGEDAGRPATKPGLYFVRLEADGRRFTKRFATMR